MSISADERIYEELLKDVRLPSMLKVRYHFPCGRIDNLEDAINGAFARKDTIGRIKPGDTVAITAGSREIAGIASIMTLLAGRIRSAGGHPFIVPAMGSHGGATAYGQSEMLEGFGISEKLLGIPVKSSMETVMIGETKSGSPVYIDKNAYEADCIILVGRIKPHTDFRGRYESGLMKMIAIGLGKQKGASVCHRLGLENMSQTVCDMASVSIRASRIIFGLGVIENAYHEISEIAAIPAEKIEHEEPALLVKAKNLIPRIPFKKVDVIVVEEMGKDFGGTGMDSNVIGRSSTLGGWEPFPERITVLDLTDKSHGNINGLGLADVTTRRLFDKMIFSQTYPNAITSAEPKAVKIPIIMPNDELAVKCAVKICTDAPVDAIRLVRIRNTISMGGFYISEALLDEAKKDTNIEIEGIVSQMEFDDEGNLIR